MHQPDCDSIRRLRSKTKRPPLSYEPGGAEGPSHLGQPRGPAGPSELRLMLSPMIEPSDRRSELQRVVGDLTPGPIPVVMWSFADDRRAVLCGGPNEAKDLLRRVMGRFRGGACDHATLMASFGQLADPDQAVTARYGRHVISIVRPYVAGPDVGEASTPTLISIAGLGKAPRWPCLFADVAAARQWVRDLRTHGSVLIAGASHSSKSSTMAVESCASRSEAAFARRWNPSSSHTLVASAGADRRSGRSSSLTFIAQDEEATKQPDWASSSGARRRVVHTPSRSRAGSVSAYARRNRAKP